MDDVKYFSEPFNWIPSRSLDPDSLDGAITLAETVMDVSQRLYNLVTEQRLSTAAESDAPALGGRHVRALCLCPHFEWRAVAVYCHIKWERGAHSSLLSPAMKALKRLAAVLEAAECSADERAAAYGALMQAAQDSREGEPIEQLAKSCVGADVYSRVRLLCVCVCVYLCVLVCMCVRACACGVRHTSCVCARVRVRLECVTRAVYACLLHACSRHGATLVLTRRLASVSTARLSRSLCSVSC